MTNKLLAIKKREQFIEENGIIYLENVSKVYSKGSPAINGMTLGIGKGEFVFIVGDSGSGKSTLIRLLLRELVASSGSVYVMGSDLAKLKHRQVPKFRRNLGVVFQDFRLLNDRNVYENVAFAQRIIEVPSKDIRRNVPSILATVGLAGKYKAKTKQLSGGEQQRAAILRALLSEPDIILADEPTGNLDSKNTQMVVGLLRYFSEHMGKTILFITHNMELTKYCSRVIAVKDGKIIT